MDRGSRHNGARSFVMAVFAAVAFTMLIGVFGTTARVGAQTLAADARGRLVVTTVATTARYHPDGALDTGFGVDGIAATPVGDFDRRPAVDVSANGVVIIAACAFSEAAGVTFELARLTAAGEPDPSFHSDQIAPSDSDRACVTQVRMVAGGRILVAGYRFTPDGASDFTAARFNSDGSPDARFGAGGRLVSDLPLGPMAVNANGEIFALAVEGSSFRDTVHVARFTRDGQLDYSFGNGGIASVSLPAYSYFEHIALTPDGRIVLGGSLARGTGEPYAAIARLTRSGQLDSGFGQGGMVATRISWSDFIWVTAIDVEPNGTVHAAGVTYGPPFVPHETRVVLMRFDRRGRQDTSFGTNGFYLRPAAPMAATLVLLNGGDVVLGWHDTSSQYVLARVRRR